MNAHVTIKLTGPNIPEFLPIGASISYGINRVPIASVQLNPSALFLICDFDSIRRKPVTLSITTTNGCIFFDGLIDGLTFNQSPGGLQTTLIIKHKMQWLNEIFPRIIGIHASSLDVFEVHKLVDMQMDSKDTVNLDTNEFLARVLSIGADQINFDQNIIDFTINLLKVAVTSQTDQQLTVTPDYVDNLHLKDILNLSDLNVKALTQTVVDLLASIDTTATKGLVVRANRQAATASVTAVASMKDNIFSNLVRMVSDVGCCVIVGSRTTYIVPEASFLAIPKVGSTRIGKTSTRPNTIFPAEYDNFVFNDNGYINIKGVYVIPYASADLTGVTNGGRTDMGFYVDTSATGNILVTTLPETLSYGLVEAAVIGSTGLQPKIKNQEPFLSSKILTNAVTTDVENTRATIQGMNNLASEFLGQWAQCEYSRLKYDDRTGNINCYFNNNWVPGAVGSLYTRQPGTYIDFFVTDVTHTFQVSAPSNGTATTSISFKAGRAGSTTNNGLSSLDLYDYDFDKSQTFCKAFLKDIST